MVRIHLIEACLFHLLNHNAHLSCHLNDVLSRARKIALHDEQLFHGTAGLDSFANGVSSHKQVFRKLSVFSFESAGAERALLGVGLKGRAFFIFSVIALGGARPFGALSALYPFCGMVSVVGHAFTPCAEILAIVCHWDRSSFHVCAKG